MKILKTATLLIGSLLIIPSLSGCFDIRIPMEYEDVSSSDIEESLAKDLMDLKYEKGANGAISKEDGQIHFYVWKMSWRRELREALISFHEELTSYAKAKQIIKIETTIKDDTFTIKTNGTTIYSFNQEISPSVAFILPALIPNGLIVLSDKILFQIDSLILGLNFTINPIDSDYRIIDVSFVSPIFIEDNNELYPLRNLDDIKMMLNNTSPNMNDILYGEITNLELGLEAYTFIGTFGNREYKWLSFSVLETGSYAFGILSPAQTDLSLELFLAPVAGRSTQNRLDNYISIDKNKNSWAIEFQNETTYYFRITNVDEDLDISYSSFRIDKV